MSKCIFYNLRGGSPGEPDSNVTVTQLADSVRQLVGSATSLEPPTKQEFTSLERISGRIFSDKKEKRI